MFDRIVLNIPHSSPVFPFGKECWDVGIDVSIERWTDWNTDDLFNLNHPCILPVIYPYSRFFCDVERLPNDPLEQEGQGIVYKSFEGFQRKLSRRDVEAIMATYDKHIAYLRQAIIGERSLLLDCHSFPSDLSEIEICIGFNEDWSKPIDTVIEQTVSHFAKEGYRVGINLPYSNSISPLCSTVYSSLMIEVNKNVYMRGANEIEPLKSERLKRTIYALYDLLFSK